MRSIMKVKSSRNGEITLSFSDLGKSCSLRICNIANMSFNALSENLNTSTELSYRATGLNSGLSLYYLS